MSYHIEVANLRRWLDKSQLALVSKNKVRKDLWTDFGDIILFEEGHNTIPVSSSEFTTIQSFLQNEGRSDSISNDSMLNWITMLHELRRKLVKEMQSRSISETASVVSTPRKQVEQHDHKAVEKTEKDLEIHHE